MLVAAKYQNRRYHNQKAQKIFQQVTNRQPASAPSKYLRGL